MWQMGMGLSYALKTFMEKKNPGQEKSTQMP